MLTLEVGPDFIIILNVSSWNKESLYELYIYNIFSFVKDSLHFHYLPYLGASRFLNFPHIEINARYKTHLFDCVCI